MRPQTRGQKRVDRLAQSYVDEFNRLYPVGTPVILRKDSGEVSTVVREPAYVFCGSAVAMFKGVSGAYSIEDDRVRLAPVEVSGPNPIIEQPELRGFCDLPPRHLDELAAA